MLVMFNSALKYSADRRFIINICIFALFLRFILSLLHYYAAWNMQRGSDFIGDARAYSASAQYIAEVITKKPAQDIDNNEIDWVNYMRDTYLGSLPNIGYRADMFVRHVGFIYAVFGYNPIIIKLVNSLLSVFTGILLFMIARKFFSEKTAKIVLVLTLFWPSILLWSVTGIKESILIFLIALNFFLYLMHLRKVMNTIWFIALLAVLAYSHYSALFLFSALFCLWRFIRTGGFKSVFACLAWIAFMKFSFVFLELSRPHILSLLLMAFITERLILLKKSVLFPILIAIGIICWLNPDRFDFAERYNRFTRVLIDRQGHQLYSAYTAYKVYPEKYYNSNLDISGLDLVFSYLKGFSYVLFSPFPFSNLRNISGFLGLMQALLFYMLFPFIIIGIFIALRYRYKDMLIFPVFIFITLSSYALVEGNVGSVFRHRDTAVIFMFIFAALGINHVWGRQGRIIYE